MGRRQNEDVEFTGIWESIPRFDGVVEYEEDDYPRFSQIVTKQVTGLPRHFSFKTKKGCRGIGYEVKDNQYVVLYEAGDVNTGEGGGMLFELEATAAHTQTMFRSGFLEDQRYVNLEIVRKFHFIRDPFWLRDAHSADRLAEYADTVLETQVQEYEKWIYNVHQNSAVKNTMDLMDLLVLTMNRMKIVADKKLVGRYDRQRQALVFTRSLSQNEVVGDVTVITEVIVLPVDMANLVFREELIDPLRRKYPERLQDMQPIVRHKLSDLFDLSSLNSKENQ